MEYPRRDGPARASGLIEESSVAIVGSNDLGVGREKFVSSDTSLNNTPVVDLVVTFDLIPGKSKGESDTG